MVNVSLPPQAGQCVLTDCPSLGECCKICFCISAMCPNINTTGGGVRPFYHMKKESSRHKKRPPTEVGGQLARREITRLSIRPCRTSHQSPDWTSYRICDTQMLGRQGQRYLPRTSCLLGWTLAHGCAFVHLFLHRRSLLQGHTNGCC